MRAFTAILIFAYLGASGQDVVFCGERMPIEEESVKNRLKNALERNAKDTSNTLLKERIKLYLPYFAIVLRQYRLPDDLKYIPLAESRLQRRIVSPAGAGGTWQFMAQTAISEGLTPEQRSSIIESTHAACRLLQKLYRQLHSWPLVVAAYNYGAGNLRKATAQQQTEDFYRLHLNPETSNYIFNLAALKIIYGSNRPAIDTSIVYIPHQQRDSIKAGWHTSGFFRTTNFSNPKTSGQ